MFQRTERGGVARRPGPRCWAVIAAAVLLTCGVARGDEVSRFLERHGLQRLLAVHLEKQLETSAAAERDRIVVRLAGLYAQLLEQTDDEALRQWIEQRSRQLLGSSPSGATDELRLALLRGSYRNAERIAENHRLRLATESALETARAILTEVLPKLVQLATRLEEQATLLDRRLTRASGGEAIATADEIDEVRRRLAQCNFLRGWALYYQSWLHDRRENARVAERVFMQLLDPDKQFLEPDEVSVDLRGVEPVARSILGVALCKSMTASTATAISWIQLLQHERTYRPLREQAPAWKIAIYLENGGFRSARGVLEAALANQQVPLAWLRLAAVYALQSPDRDRDSRELIDLVVTELAGRGELDQILDLAERYGAEALGNSGFALRYVRGVIAYHDAREAHGDESSVVPPRIAAMYDEAVEALRGALAETDAEAYPEALAAAHRLVAWCLYFKGEFLDARSEFELASNLLGGDEAADALWMAIVCLDKVTDVGGSGRAALVRDLNALIEQFLETYPSSEHAPKLVLKQAIAADEPTEEMVQQLLAVSPTSEVYPRAQRQAAHLLYRMYRDASGAEQRQLADSYLDLVGPVLAEDAALLAESDDLDRRRFLVRCRRAVEVALEDGSERPLVARTVLETVEGLAAEGVVDLGDYVDEFDYRRIRLHLISDDPLGAAGIADSMWERDRQSPWARQAARVMFRHGYETWKSASAGADDRQALSAIVRYGGRVLQEYEDDESALQQPAVLNYYVAVAESCMTIWDRSRDEQMGRRALFLFERLLEARPDNAGFLRATGVLAEAFGREERALECWRRLVAGTPLGSDAWYEAKFHLISALAAGDPQRARAVMDQHKGLHPEYGPDPWGARLKALDLRLPPPAEPEQPDVPPSEGGA
ncbi:MAG: hypothetical protein ACYTGC_00505 [Planctomycetota bacterium]|jgi:tetratricopeptide (TPR) repeat protein